MQLNARWVQPEEISVLLIEDSPTDAAAITKAMVYGESLYDFKITAKESLTDAVLFLETTPVDVILLDLNLPDAKRLNAIDEIYSKFPDIPTVIITGSSDMEMVGQALHRGAKEFLIKGECSGVVIRQSLYQAIVRKQIEQSYLKGDRL